MKSSLHFKKKNCLFPVNPLTVGTFCSHLTRLTFFGTVSCEKTIKHIQKKTIFVQFRGKNEKIQVTSRSIFYKLVALGISVLILAGCGGAKKDFGFQAQVPTSNKGLEEIFEDFSSVDTGDVTMGGVLDRAEDAVEMNHAITNTLLLELGRLSSPENPALPKMLDIVATAVDSSYRSYESLENGAADVNSAVEIGTRILDLPPATIMKGSKTLAKLIEYIGNMTILFPDDVMEDGSNRFPTLASWEQCESPRQYNSTFESVSDNSSVERKALVLTYDLLKISYCLYENIETYQPDIENLRRLCTMYW